MPAYTTETRETGGRREVAATALFLLLAAVLNYLPAEAQQRVASALRSTVLRPFVLTQEGLATARVRATESERLRERLDSVVSVATSRTTLVEENRRLRGLLSLSSRIGPGYRAAVVVRPGTAGSESMFLVDVGTADGVRAPAAVITREGLVGVVRDVGERSSIGMDWTHPEFSASAMTLDGTTTGMVESHRGDFREEDRLVLNGTAFHTSLDQGTKIVTSGLGGVYPRGVPIGRVWALAEADAGWRKAYWLEPSVQPGTARHVLVAVRSEEGTPPADVSDVWPEDSILNAEEMVRMEDARRDSLRAVEDSLGMLRAILEAQRGLDSLRGAVATDSDAPLRRPAPPSGSATGNPSPTPPQQGGVGTGERARPAEPPATAPPDTVRADTTRPATTPPDTARPDTTRPDTTRPDTTRPDTTRPDTTERPDTTRLDTTRLVRPGAVRPDATVEGRR